MSVLWNKFSSQEKHGKRNHIIARCMKSKTYGLFVSHFLHICSVLTDRFGKMESAFHFSEMPIYFLSFLLLFCQLEKGCFKWLKMIPKKIKARNTLEKFKTTPEVLMKSYNFIKDIILGEGHFFKIPGEGILAMEVNSTYISLYVSG